MYLAASEGNVFIENNALVADDDAAVAVYDFFDQMNKNGYLLAQETTDPFETGLALTTQFVPFRFLAMHEKYPDLKYEENYVVAAAPVPDDVPVENVKTMSDNKGVVIYSQVSEEKQKAAYEFIKWVYTMGPMTRSGWILPIFFRHRTICWRMKSLPPCLKDLRNWCPLRRM